MGWSKLLFAADACAAGNAVARVGETQRRDRNIRFTCMLIVRCRCFDEMSKEDRRYEWSEVSGLTNNGTGG